MKYKGIIHVPVTAMPPFSAPDIRLRLSNLDAQDVCYWTKEHPDRCFYYIELRNPAKYGMHGYVKVIVDESYASCFDCVFEAWACVNPHAIEGEYTFDFVTKCESLRDAQTAVEVARTIQLIRSMSNAESNPDSCATKEPE